jgi:hypothetical protein
LTLAAKNSAILKISIVASVLLASSGVGYYYYLVYLPQREVQFDPQRVLERFRAAAEKRAAGAEQELSLFEQIVSEQRAAEQKMAEERQVLEKANRYQACLTRATDSYNSSRLAACNRSRETKTIALTWAFPETYARWRTLSPKLRQIANCHGLSRLLWKPR